MTDKIEYRLENDDTEMVAYIDGERVGDISMVKTGADKLIIDHTSVNKKFQGKNIGTGLVKSVVELARRRNLKIIPLCPFARAVFERHPEFDDVIHGHANQK